MENHETNFCIKYSREKTDMTHWFPYLHLQHWISWNNLFVGYNILLQLLVRGFLTVILLLRFLSLVMSWTNAEPMIIKQKAWMVIKEY